ncbi:MAG: hypothetical protein AUG51_02420 [Acidobacteria bacterium 13_1_20CM_3_53_8]|nr:MAG: hypothetical protein AUG51_02420 [Acidobacteria bacterium 13_1_20CM_3_53_8]
MQTIAPKHLSTSEAARRAHRVAGFSLLELLIAMTILLAVMAAASTLLSSSIGTRTRENKRSDGLSEAQRALNIISRDAGNSGYGLTDNGIVASDSSATSIRIRANSTSNSALTDQDEDVRYVYQSAKKAIVRYDAYPAASGGTTTVLASGIDSLNIKYWDATNVEITSAGNYPNAVRVTVDVIVNLPAPNGQDITATATTPKVRLVTDIALRNAPTSLDQF